MAARSSIDYLLARHKDERPGASWSPFLGCSQYDDDGQIREGCRFCWARDWAKRAGFKGHWGPDAPRYFFGETHWEQPLRWQRACEKAGKRMRVLPSICDPFQILPVGHPRKTQMALELGRFLNLIRETPNLDWLVLTKRPENIPRDVLAGLRLENLWLGTSVWDQASADRNIPLLFKAWAALYWVSAEPLLGPLDLCHIQTDTVEIDALNGTHGVLRPHQGRHEQRLGWLVVGCESRGPRPGRLCQVTWAEKLVAQCKVAGVPMFTKQLELPGWPGKIIKSDKLAQLGWPVEMPKGHQP